MSASERRIIGHFVVKNEADRYLERVLRHHQQFCDELFVYDDNSTDDSVKIAQKYATVVRGGPWAFMENESRCRQEAWDSMRACLNLVAGRDWVLCMDADEFFVAVRSEREMLESLIEHAEECNANALDLKIDEIFDAHDGEVFRRLDGFWGDIHAPRFIKMLNEGGFRRVGMGGGSVPDYVKPVTALDGARILHFGYAMESDRHSKYDRYSSKSKNGHNPKHIESILGTPELEFAGAAPW